MGPVVNTNRVSILAVTAEFSQAAMNLAEHLSYMATCRSIIAPVVGTADREARADAIRELEWAETHKMSLEDLLAGAFNAVMNPPQLAA